MLVWLGLSLVLAGCTGDQIGVSSDSGEAPTAIPTFTPEPSTPFPTPTITPTPIIVPPTDTPAPTATPTRPPSATAAPSTTVPPTTVLPTLSNDGRYQEITVDQARNLNGYRTLLPTYLPEGFKLSRINYSQIGGSPVFSLIIVFENAQNQAFYLNIQYVPPLPTVAPTFTPSENPVITLPPSSALTTPTLPPTRSGPFPTSTDSNFSQYAVPVRNVAGLLSYNNTFTSLSWSEPSGNYALNGLISPDDALKVAASLS